MKKLLGVVLYFFVLHKQLDAKSGNLRTSDVKNEQVEKRKKIPSGWVPYYLPPKGQTTPIALLAALPEKTNFRKSANMRKDVKEKEEGEENVNSLIQSVEKNDEDFQFSLQIVEGADDSTESQLEGESSPADAAHTAVSTGEVDDLERGEALLEQDAGHTAEHAAELVTEMVEEPVAAPAAEGPRVAEDQNGEAPQEEQSLPVEETDEVSVEERQEGTPSMAEQALDENLSSHPADASVPEPNESNGSNVDTAEEASGKENFYHLEEDEEEEEDGEEMEDEEFEDDYDNVMHKINEHEGEAPSSNDGSKDLTRRDIIIMLAVRNLLSSLNYDYGVMDFLTGFNPGVTSSFFVF